MPITSQPPSVHDQIQCLVLGSATAQLSMDEHSPGVARRFVEREICRVHHAERLDEVQLLATELVTNGVTYGSPPIVLTLRCTGPGGLRLEVADGSPAMPRPRQATDGDEGGRGLTLVEYISDAWGVESRPDGKVVWCVLR